MCKQVEFAGFRDAKRFTERLRCIEEQRIGARGERSGDRGPESPLSTLTFVNRQAQAMELDVVFGRYVDVDVRDQRQPERDCDFAQRAFSRRKSTWPLEQETQGRWIDARMIQRFTELGIVGKDEQTGEAIRCLDENVGPNLVRMTIHFGDPSAEAAITGDVAREQDGARFIR